MGNGQADFAIVGRRTEMDLLSGAMHNLDRGTGVTLRLRGDSGMGKTTLLDWLSTQPGANVIRLAGSQSDADLAFSGLASLLKGLANLGVEIPPEHAQVLSDAVGAGSSQGQLTVGGATLAALAAAGEQSPLLLLIDDGQWIDEPSCTALAFALKRLPDEPVVAVIGERSGVPSTFAKSGFETIELAGVDVDDAMEILGPGTDQAVARRCVEASEGNPLALREMARVLDGEQLSGASRLPDDLAEGGQIIRLFVDRVNALDDADKYAMAVVAAAIDATAADIRLAAIRMAQTTVDFGAAEFVGMTYVSPESIELTHPLLRDAIGEALGPDVIRQAHAALAEVVTEPDKRTWHMASAAPGPDESVAAELEQVAVVADRRGAWASAAATWERAAALSPDAAQRHRRLLAAGNSRWNAADPFTAIAVLEEVTTDAEDPMMRSDAISVRSEAIAWMISENQGIDELAAEAEAIAPIDPERAIALFIRASLHGGLSGRPIDCHRFAQSAVDLAEQAGTPMLIAARAVRAMALQRLGERDRAEADLEGTSIIKLLPMELLDARLLPILQATALARMTQERWHDANEVLELSMTAARHHGLASVLGFSGALQGELYLRCGRLTEAVLSSVFDVDLNDLPDLPTASFGQAVLARVEAVLGRPYSARSHADAAIARARRVGMRVLETWAVSALGHVALAAGGYDEAAEHLRRVHRLHEGVLDAGDLWYQGDLLEALFAIGAVDEAAEVLDEVAAKAQKSESRWGAAVVLRGEGMLHGRAEDLGNSAEALAALGAPFEQARSLLLLGERHGDHEASRAALRIFERIGAEPWAAQARRIAGPVAPTSSALASVLTTAELRVAVSIARGRTDREVADELYLSRKAVEAHFYSILRKLGVANRDELTAYVNRDIEQTPL